MTERPVRRRDARAAGGARRRARRPRDRVGRASAPTSSAGSPSPHGAVCGPRDAQLDRRTRSCITVALLTALRAEGELALHLRAARRNGVTPAELAEVIMHTAGYAGIPAANSAMAIAERVLAEPEPA